MYQEIPESRANGESWSLRHQCPCNISSCGGGRKAFLDHERGSRNSANDSPLFEIHSCLQGFEKSHGREIWLCLITTRNRLTMEIPQPGLHLPPNGLRIRKDCVWGQFGTALLMGLPSEQRFPERDVPRTPGHDDIRGTRDPALRTSSGHCSSGTTLEMALRVSTPDSPAAC